MKNKGVPEELRKKLRVRLSQELRKGVGKEKVRSEVEQVVEGDWEANQRVLEMIFLHSCADVDVGQYFYLIFGVLGEGEVSSTLVCLLLLKQGWREEWEVKGLLGVLERVWGKMKAAKVLILEVLAKLSREQALVLFPTPLWLSLISSGVSRSTSLQIAYLTLFSNLLQYLPPLYHSVLVHKGIPRLFLQLSRHSKKKVAELSLVCLTHLINFNS